MFFYTNKYYRKVTLDKTIDSLNKFIIIKQIFSLKTSIFFTDCHLHSFSYHFSFIKYLHF